MKRGLIAFLVLANLGVFFVYWQIRNVEQTVVRSAETIPASELSPVLVDTPTGSADPVTFLIIGSDSREGLDSLDNFGPSGGQRADVIILLRVQPDDGTAEMLSIPRDTWVDVPGHGSRKINAAFALGGAALMVETVSNETGIDINHYVQIDFVGFQAIVDELGGVKIDFPYPARDVKSGLDVQAGTQLLDGRQALAYARSRTYQEYRNGKWVAVDANDIGRTRRQQQLLFTIIRTIARPASLTGIGGIVESFASHLTIDSALAEGSLVELAWRMRAVRPDAINAATLPTRTDTIDGASVEIRVEPAAQDMIDAFKAGEPLVVADDSTPMRLQVLNGNGIPGSAGTWSDVLTSDGFDVVDVGDAERKDFEMTTILTRPENVKRAGAIAEALGFGIVEVGSVENGVDAVVILGSDAAPVP